MHTRPLYPEDSDCVRPTGDVITKGGSKLGCYLLVKAGSSGLGDLRVVHQAASNTAPRKVNKPGSEKALQAGRVPTL